MFRIVKYLNSVHVSLFAKVPVEEGAGDLLRILGVEYDQSGPTGLLYRFRQLDLKD
jgi:hypothetical protein